MNGDIDKALKSKLEELLKSTSVHKSCSITKNP
jgi:hypothetical protein